MEKTPDSRFDDYMELEDKNGNLIGFNLKDDDHDYLFDKYGGWYDKENRYFNSDAIEC